MPTPRSVPAALLGCTNLRIVAASLVAAVFACSDGRSGGAGGAGAAGGTADVIAVYNAGSLSRPLRAALDTFAARTGARIEQESAGSLETARKLTELGKIPDVVALADYQVFPQLLIPRHVTWYVQFARNRMVLAHTPRARGAAEIDSTNWWRIVQRPDVEMGRADPNLDPNGYRTLLVMQLAERHYGERGLYDRLVAAAPRENVRPKEADLVALLQAGELDYAWSYESLAQSTGLQYVVLPAAIDLSDPTLGDVYTHAEVRVLGGAPGDTLTFRGEPIVYGLSIPTAAPHPATAERFVAFLLSADGQRVLRGAKLDALTSPVLVGSGAPEAVRQFATGGSRP